VVVTPEVTIGNQVFNNRSAVLRGSICHMNPRSSHMNPWSCMPELLPVWWRKVRAILALAKRNRGGRNRADLPPATDDAAISASW